jgi:hypothetical protein
MRGRASRAETAPQHGPGRLQVGVCLGVGRTAALVVASGQMISQRIFENLVCAQWQVRRIPGDARRRQVLAHRAWLVPGGGSMAVHCARGS